MMPHDDPIDPAQPWLKKVQWDEHGLVPVIAQEAGSGDILMFAWMNREALAKTVELGEAVYWSRSRKKLWHKGEESGHVQKVLEIRLDCDEDVVLLKVEQAGGIACHTGRHSCFFQKFDAGRLAERRAGAAGPGHRSTRKRRKAMSDILDRLAATIESRKPENGGDPATSYVAKLFAKGDDAILKKIGEEATETVMAAKDVRAGADVQAAVRSGRPVVPFDGAAGKVRPDAAAGAGRTGAPRRIVRHRRKSVASAR
jgi:phosphoribosyl-AMP cyclohydrolase